MRDIRQDLRERRDFVRAKRIEHAAAAERLLAQEKTLDSLIEEEDAIWEKLAPRLFEGTDEQQGSVLSQVLLDTLKSKSDLSASLDELKESAVQRGVPFGEKKPGRVIHFAMLGMEQHDLVAKTPDGRWQLVELKNPVN